MSQKELSTTYSSNETEAKWYPHWESNGYFKPREGKTGESYCIIMPPPNVTGQLHMEPRSRRNNTRCTYSI